MAFDLVARFEEGLGAFALGFVVVRIDFQAEANLFEDRVRLILTSFFCFLCCLVFELAVVHYFDDGWVRVGGNLHQIKVSLLS